MTAQTHSSDENLAWDVVCDVIVVGSGGSGLTAATLAHDGGSDVVVLEKADQVGGTTAVSGGVMWLPGNGHMTQGNAAAERDESTAALKYMRALTEMSTDLETYEELIAAFVDAAPAALRYLEAYTPLRTSIVEGLADYYHSFGVAGSVASGRSVEPVPFAVGEELPDWRGRLASRGTLMSLGATTTLAEDIAKPNRILEAELERREREDVRSKGAALVAMLLKGLLDRGIEPGLGMTVDDLVIADDSTGRVVGVSAVHDGTVMRIGARRGVVLACGGFEWNASMVRTHLGDEVVPLTPPNNVGDAVTMSLRAGAELGQMTSFWGQPAMFDPTVLVDGVPVGQFEWGRGAASSLIVDRSGNRFANEALPYHDFSRQLATRGSGGQRFPDLPPAWMIFDARVKRSMRLLSMEADDEAPAWVARAATVADLGRLIGLPDDALAATVRRFDADARVGVDRLYGRTAEGMTGPGRVRPLVEPPYFALPIYSGAIGTAGGPRTDADGRVVRQGGGIVPGLYAVGNAAASPLGGVYPGGGGTIGPAVVFAYRAGRDAASRSPLPLAVHSR